MAFNESFSTGAAKKKGANDQLITLGWNMIARHLKTLNLIDRKTSGSAVFEASSIEIIIGTIRTASYLPGIT